MATHSNIGKTQADGSIRFIYCHSDGRYVGPMLKQYYADPAKIDALIGGGDIWSLGESIACLYLYTDDIWTVKRGKAFVPF